MPTRRARLAVFDWLMLLASLVAGGIAGHLALLLGIRIVLEPRMVSETALRLSNQVELVEMLLQYRQPEELPSSVTIRGNASLAEWQTRPTKRFDRLVQEAMRREFRLDRLLLPDQPPWWIQVAGTDTNPIPRRAGGAHLAPSFDTPQQQHLVPAAAADPGDCGWRSWWPCAVPAAEDRAATVADAEAVERAGLQRPLATLAGGGHQADPSVEPAHQPIAGTHQQHSPGQAPAAARSHPRPGGPMPA